MGTARAPRRAGWAYDPFWRLVWDPQLEAEVLDLERPAALEVLPAGTAREHWAVYNARLHGHEYRVRNGYEIISMGPGPDHFWIEHYR